MLSNKKRLPTRLHACTDVCYAWPWFYDLQILMLATCMPMLSSFMDGATCAMTLLKWEDPIYVHWKSRGFWNVLSVVIWHCTSQLKWKGQILALHLSPCFPQLNRAKDSKDYVSLCLQHRSTLLRNNLLLPVGALVKKCRSYTLSTAVLLGVCSVENTDFHDPSQSDWTCLLFISFVVWPPQLFRTLGVWT